MFKTLSLGLIILFLCVNFGKSQGTNNDFDFDNEDFKFLFSKMGYGVFKFPVRQSKEQIFDIVVKEYRNGELTNRQTAIDVTQEAFKDFGIDAKRYARPKMDSTMTDSVYFHRFYVERNDSILTLHTKTHGLSVPIKFDITDLAVGDVRARYETKEEIDDKGFIEVDEGNNVLLLFYANEDHSLPLWCPAGLELEKIREQFYYSVFVYISEVD